MRKTRLSFSFYGREPANERRPRTDRARGASKEIEACWDPGTRRLVPGVESRSTGDGPTSLVGAEDRRAEDPLAGVADDRAAGQRIAAVGDRRLELILRLRQDVRR